jgi:SAM-dependent methyltransferase
MSLSDDDVRNAYLFILGRLPESERAVQRHQQAHANVRELRAAFLASSEFVGLTTPALPSPFVGLEPPEDIETAADAGTLARIVEKTGDYWSAIGETAPHWSVITDDRYRPENLSANETAFYQSGAGDRDLAVALLRRIGRDPLEFRCCVEFGCGVGRATIPLSKTFAKMIAVDISRSHLAAAADHAKSAGLSNVHFVQATPENLMPATGYDLWFSRLVLQHNAPPVNLAILDKAFAGLPSGGVAIVHIPTWQKGYRFKIGDYLAEALGQHMEMHATPQREILDLAFRHGCGLRNIHEEPGHVVWITNIFVFQKDSSDARQSRRGESPT